MHPPTHRYPLTPLRTPQVYPSALYPLYSTILAPYDLSRGGVPYIFNAHTDIKELALYVRDNITIGKWSLNLGLRGDRYNGLPSGSNSNLVLERLTTSRKPTRSSAFPTPALWNLPLTKICYFPASDAAMMS